jgi:hypothetical protein
MIGGGCGNRDMDVDDGSKWMNKKQYKSGVILSSKGEK